MKSIQIAFIFIVSLFIVGSSCQSDTNTKEIKTPSTTPLSNNPKPSKVPKFEKDSAYQFIQEQVAFGPRVPNTSAHQACKDYLVAKLSSFGANVIEQNFKAEAYTGTVLNGTNIVGQYNPSAKKRIILAAHWDSRHISDHDPDESKRKEPVLGADDGASGVGVLLEIARLLQANPIENMGIDIIFFDAEDHGDGGDDADANTWCIGSQYWSNNPHVSGYRADYGILLDMVGGKSARFPIEAVSAKYAPNIIRKVWRLAQKMGYGDYFSAQNVGGVTDDHLFVNTIAKIPMIDIINLPTNTEKFVKHWHTTDDTMENIDTRTLRAAGQVVLATIYNEAMGRL